MGIKVARHDSSLVRPVMHGQREVVAYNRNLIGFRGLLDQGRRATAHGTLQIFEYNNGHLRAFGRTEYGINRVLSCSANRGGHDAKKCDARDNETTVDSWFHQFL